MSRCNRNDLSQYLQNDTFVISKQGRKRPLDTPKRMIERRERERKVEGEIQRGGRDKRERERERGERDRDLKGIERVKGAQSKPNPLPNAYPNYVRGSMADSY